MPAMPSQKVFAVRDEEFHWEDVLLAARYWGEWDAFVENARFGLACRKAAGDRIRESAEAAANEFRYERDLIAAEEMETWLAARGLEVDDWSAYFERAVLRDECADAPSEMVARHPVAATELESLLQAEAMCSGSAQRWSLRLAGEAAVHEASGAPATGAQGEARLERLQDSYRQFAVRVVTEPAVRKAIAAHRLDWQRVDGYCVRFATQAQAREAALCVREDGDELRDVAVQARCEVERFSRSLDECPPPLAALLQNASAGEMVGPLDEADGHALCVLESRQAPDYAMASVRERAERDLLQRAVEAEVQCHVRWTLLP